MPFNPIVNVGELLLLNSGNIAVCTLWTPRKRWKEFVPSQWLAEGEEVSVVGNLYAPKGIENIFRNLYANPHITSLYVVGNDINKDLVNALTKAFQEGITVAVKGASEPRLLKPSWVNLICINREGSVPAHTVKGMDVSRFPVRYDPPEFVSESLNIPYSGAFFYGENLKEVWDQICFYIQKFGIKCPTRYGDMYEIIGLTSVVDQVHFQEGLPFTEIAGTEYVEKILEGNPVAGVSYTYGQRLKGVFDTFPDKVKVHPVYWPIYYVSDQEREEPPCLVSCWWRERQGKLVGVYVFRSHDMCQGYPLNIYGLHHVQKTLADKSGLECGQMVIHSHSAHIYERDFRQDIPSGIVIDRIGDFVISVELDYIQVDLIREGCKVHQFRGKTAQGLERKISPYLSSYSHAMFLGRELFKAELRLKGVDYG